MTKETKTWIIIRLSVLVLAIVFAGCLNYEEKIILHEDGSGKIIIHYSIGEKFTELAQQQAAEEGEENPFKDLFSIEAIKKQFSGSKDITVENIEVYKQTGRYHARVELSFKDINNLSQEWLLLANRLITFRKEGDEELEEMMQMAVEGWTVRYIVEFPSSKILYVNAEGRIEKNTVTWEFPLIYEDENGNQPELVAIISPMPPTIAVASLKKAACWGSIKKN